MRFLPFALHPHAPPPLPRLQRRRGVWALWNITQSLHSVRTRRRGLPRFWRYRPQRRMLRRLDMCPECWQHSRDLHPRNIGPVGPQPSLQLDSSSQLDCVWHYSRFRECLASSARVDHARPRECMTMKFLKCARYACAPPRPVLAVLRWPDMQRRQRVCEANSGPVEVCSSQTRKCGSA